ncbi:PIN domain-containing protein [Sphingomonas sp.]|jgi:predicted nucleic acid-binding protein|uniref:PIN domain-containing protein n=1 Tax=Sphingomonas sp. TaxID=28214 RepID=UPI002ED9AA86
MPVERHFFDSNVLVYTIERDARRQSIAQDLLAQGGVISVQCLNEFARVAHRKLGLSWPEVEQARDGFLILCEPVLPLTLAIHKAGMSLASALRLSIYDALIVAAALSGNCDVLYSEDMHAGLVIDGRLRIANPFAPT